MKEAANRYYIMMTDLLRIIKILIIDMYMEN